MASSRIFQEKAPDCGAFAQFLGIGNARNISFTLFPGNQLKSKKDKRDEGKELDPNGFLKPLLLRSKVSFIMLMKTRILPSMPIGRLNGNILRLNGFGALKRLGLIRTAPPLVPKMRPKTLRLMTKAIWNPTIAPNLRVEDLRMSML